MTEVELNKYLEQPIVKSHMDYLGCICDMWPLRYEQAKASRLGNKERADEIDRDLIPYKEKAANAQNAVVIHRKLIVDAYQSDRALRQSVNSRCRDDYVYFINNFCWTVDPRVNALGLSPNIPFVLWPKQVEFLNFVHECYCRGDKWLAEKSRAYGLTWLIAAYYAWQWLFHENFWGGFGSRKVELVDNGDDPNSIFYKVRWIVYNTPDVVGPIKYYLDPMRPREYLDKTVTSRAKDDKSRLMTNPENGSFILGEGGDDIGRGGRTTIYVVDEKSSVLHQQSADNALSQNTDCQGDISTVKGMNEFYNRMKSGKVRVFTAWWYHDPAKNKNWKEDSAPAPKTNAWLNLQYATMDEIAVRQEILIDYQAGIGDSFIPSDWVNTAIDFDAELPGMDDGDSVAGFDVAGGGKNKSVYTLRRGAVVKKQLDVGFATSTEAAVEVFRFCEEDNVSLLNYDRDGLGEGIEGLPKILDRPLTFKLNGIHGNSPASSRIVTDDGKKASEVLMNKRAENWNNLRQRFKNTYEHRTGFRMHPYSEMISIPNDRDLVLQLSQPKKVTRGMRYGVESKKDMISRGVKSPDKADSLADAFADADIDLVLNKFDPTSGKRHLIDFTVNHEAAFGDSYVSVVQTPDLMLHGLAINWVPNQSHPVLQVYYEYVDPDCDVKNFVNAFKTIMCANKRSIKKWIGNDEIIKGLDKGKTSAWYEFKKNGAKIRQNYLNDWRGSFMLVNSMFGADMIQLHTRCQKLWMQISAWKIENGKPREGLGLVMALCQIVSMLKRKKEIKDIHLDPQFRVRNPFKGSVARFGRTSKVDNSPTPDYIKRMMG